LLGRIVRHGFGLLVVLVEAEKKVKGGLKSRPSNRQAKIESDYLNNKPILQDDISEDHR